MSLPLVYLVLAAVPLLCCPRAFGRGQSDVFARSVLVAVPIGLVPAVEVAYFASDATVIVSLTMGRSNSSTGEPQRFGCMSTP